MDNRFKVECFAGSKPYGPYSGSYSSWSHVLDTLRKVDPSRPHAFITKVIVSADIEMSGNYVKVLEFNI